MSITTIFYKGVPIYCEVDHKVRFYSPIDRIGQQHDTLVKAKIAVTKRLKVVVAGHRPPTPYEIKRGYGATHYRDFTLADFWDYKEHRLLSKIKADDGLWYSRS